MSRDKGKLTAKQRVFVDEYLVDMNATQAAIRAGYKGRNHDKIGSELLGKTRVAEAIRLAMEKRQKRTEITQDRVLEQYARLAFFDIRQLYDECGNLKPIKELDEDVATAIAGIETFEKISKEGEKIGTVCKVKLLDRRAALADIAKHLGMFIEKVEHSGAIETPSLKVVLSGNRHKAP